MLIVEHAGAEAELDRLTLSDGWQRRWITSWRIDGGSVAWPVSQAGSVPVGLSSPVRGFTWRARQGHRPALRFMVSTGRHHGFESLEEQRLLLALDFVRVVDVLAQPFPGLPVVSAAPVAGPPVRRDGGGNEVAGPERARPRPATDRLTRTAS